MTAVHLGGSRLTDEERRALSEKVREANRRSEQGRGGGQSTTPTT